MAERCSSIYDINVTFGILRNMKVSIRFSNVVFSGVKLPGRDSAVHICRSYTMYEAAALVRGLFNLKARFSTRCQDKKAIKKVTIDEVKIIN